MPEQKEKRPLTAILNQNRSVTTKFPGTPSAEHKNLEGRGEEKKKENLKRKAIQLCEGRESSRQLMLSPSVERAPGRRCSAHPGGAGTSRAGGGGSRPRRLRAGRAGPGLVLPAPSTNKKKL